VNTDRGVHTNDPAKRSKLAAEVDVFQPSVKREPLIKAKTPLPLSRHSYGHVAAIGVVNIYDARAFYRLVPFEGKASLFEGQARSQDAVQDDISGGADNVRVSGEGPLQTAQKFAVAHKIVIKEDEDVIVLRGLQDAVSLFA
jgi:hypothetical protein